ncbi:CAP domain-containing protein [Nannocystis pusilla]|uniref:CAP domain-containing protein n=1 Tax=Nannocystis pusilla TaxID=889268 RepID=UPI003B7DA924
MGVNDVMSHTGSDGSTFTQRISAAGYAWTAAGENIAGGYSTAAQVVNAWMASTGHCNNIMNGIFTHLGVGHYYAKSAPLNITGRRTSAGTDGLADSDARRPWQRGARRRGPGRGSGGCAECGPPRRPRGSSARRA